MFVFFDMMRNRNSIAAVLFSSLTVIAALVCIYIIVFREAKRYVKIFNSQLSTISNQIINADINIMKSILDYLTILKQSEKSIVDIGLYDTIIDKITELKKSYIDNKDNLKINFRSRFGQISLGESFELFSGKFTEIRNIAMQVSDEFVNAYIKSKDSYLQEVSKLSSIIYCFNLSAPILSDFTKIFNEFSQGLVVDIIHNFDLISKSSHKLTENIEQSLSDLEDESVENSLAYIVRKTKDLVKDFDSFNSNMDNFKDFSGNFISTTTEKLKNIQTLALSIEGIADTIKVLSLNVRIEAANIGSEGKGFRVLANELNAFTEKTMSFAHDVKNNINDAIITTQDLQNDYSKNLENIYFYMNNIKRSVETFESIMKIVMDNNRNIINQLKSFSDGIDKGIKNTVGKLQYYDITSQEVEHLGIFLKKILMDLFDENNLNYKFINNLSEDEMKKIKTEILKIINSTITTDNERKVLSKYETEFGISVNKKLEVTNTASQDIKGDNDNIILF